MGKNASSEAGNVEVRVLLPGAGLRDSLARRRRGASDVGADGRSGVGRTRLGWPSAYRVRLIVGDALCALGASTAAAAMRVSRQPDRVAVAVLFTTVTWVLLLHVLHGYQGRHLGQGAREYQVVVWAGGLMLGSAALAAYVFTLDIDRAPVFLLVLLLVATSLPLRKGMRMWLNRARAQGRYRQRTVIVGTARSATELIRELRMSPTNAFELVGACVSGLKHGSRDGATLDGVPVTGKPRDVTFVVDYNDADIVAVSGHPGLTGKELRSLAWELEERDVDLVICPGIFEVAGPRLSIRAEAGVSLLHLERPVRTGARILAKRVQDMGLALVLTALAMPVLLLVALAIRLDSPGPVLFRQKRIGQGGREFTIYKFRTMAVDAEGRLESLRASGHDVNSVLFKNRSDPRITGVGRWLRRFSIDEVPQILNVLLGEMSLVGPRPGLASEVDHYEPDAMRRLRVRPGMTGLWQVSGRSTLSWEQTVRLDLWYVDNWSPMLDLQILVRTARAVVGGRGAF